MLEISDLSKRYGGSAVVDRLTLSVQAGELVGLIGPNGAGKSTLIDLVCGFTSPTTGEIHFLGQNITGRPAHAIARLGLIRSFQLSRLWGRLTVMENMLVAGASVAREAFWRGLAGVAADRLTERKDRERARETLADFDLLSLKDAFADQLSGGQTRLLEFARIMMAGPRMVFLDEPSAGLSPTMTNRIAEAIQHLARGNMTIVLVEHNLALVEQLCARVHVMAVGTIIATGTMQDLRANEQVVSAYLGAQPHPQRDKAEAGRDK